MVEALVASGGMGSVYRAHDASSHETVALKLLRAAPLDPLEPQGLEEARFSREARLLAQRGHPGIVRYAAHGTTPSGAPYLAMEWVSGVTLARRLEGGKLSVAEAVSLGRALADVLAVIHAAGVVHRDLKPANILLVDGRCDAVKLIDFGLARLDEPSYLTLEGSRLGTPGYIAPEQARGAAMVDARADVFALGAILYEALAGCPAFAGADPIAVLGRVLLDAPTPVGVLRADAPASLAAAVHRMLAKDPGDRPADGADALLLLTLDESPASRALLSDKETLSVSVVVVLPGTDAALRSLLRSVAHQHGAEVVTLDTGALLATIGGHGTPRDHALRAVRCARALAEEAPGFAIAVVSGSVEASGGSRLGDAIERAHRLPPGGPEGESAVRLDATTRALVGGPVAPPRGRAPFVGRDRERGALMRLVESGLSGAGARVALVTGRAGSGKTRLREELSDWIAATTPRARVWVGHGDPVGAGAPFALVADMLRAPLGRGEGSLEEQRQGFAARVREVVGEGDAPRVAAFLGEVVALPFPVRAHPALAAARRDPALMAHHIGSAWDAYIGGELRASPLVLALEDLHWGDRPSVRLLERALALGEGAALAVLAFGRPEVMDAFPGLFQAHAPLALELGPLDDGACRLFVLGALGEVEEDFLVRLTSRSGGNAFHLEEIVRAASEGREISQALVAMTRARLDAVDPAARRALRAASVFGDTFWEGGVAALVGEDAEDVGTALDRLVEADLVLARGDSRVPGERELSFRHDLLREAAYAMLTARDRRVGHSLAGAWLSSRDRASDRVLAEHFERGGDGARAARCLEGSARRALDANDLALALIDARHGLELSAEDGVTGGLLLVEAEALRWRGQPRDGRARAVLAVEQDAPGSVRWFVSVGEVILCAGLGGDYEAVAVWGDRAAWEGQREGAFGPQIHAVCVAAAQLVHGDRIAEARRLRARMEELLALTPELLDDPILSAWVHKVRSWLAYFDLDLEASLQGQERAARAFEAAGDERNACVEWVNVGNTYLELGAFTRCVELTSEWLTRAVRLGLGSTAALAHMNLGYALGEIGRHREGLAELDAARALHESGEVQNPRLLAACLVYTSLVAGASGDVARAEREARTVLSLSASEATPTNRTLALSALALALLDQGKIAEAMIAAREAKATLDALGVLEEQEAVARLAFVEVMRASGDARAAHVAAREGRARILAWRVPEELRDTFLHSHPANARLLAIAAEGDLVQQ